MPRVQWRLPRTARSRCSRTTSLAAPSLPPPTRSYVWADAASPVGYKSSQVSPATGDPIGPRAQSEWHRVVPWGLSKLLRYVRSRYGSGLELCVTENGCAAPGEAQMTADAAVRDTFRTAFYRDYIDELCAAVQEGANVSTYFAWSALDNFEVRRPADRFAVFFFLRIGLQAPRQSAALGEKNAPPRPPLHSLPHTTQHPTPQWRRGYTERVGIVAVDFAGGTLARRVKDSGRWLSEHFFRVGA